MKTFRLFILALAGLLAYAASAQQPEANPPVRWRTIVRMTSPNEGTVTFKALIEPGWHLYGLELPQGGPRPTRFDLGESTGIEFTSPVTPSREPVSTDDPMFGLTLSWWDANVNFTAPFRLTGEGTPTVKAAISYMACDGNTCRPPKTERISAPVPPFAH